MGKSENSLVLASMFDIWYTIACYSQDVKSILCSFFVCFGIYVLSCWDLHFPMANLRYPARRKKNIFLAGSDLCSYTKRIQTIKIFLCIHPRSPHLYQLHINHHSWLVDPSRLYPDSLVLSCSIQLRVPMFSDEISLPMEKSLAFNCPLNP